MKNAQTNGMSKLVVAVGISLLAGAVGAIFTADAIPTWYATLAKPALTPPGWIFGPVWTALYLCMGIAAFLVWKNGLDRKDVRIALGIFLGQLALNAPWSFLFFSLRSPGGALVDIAFLWLAIAATVVAFARVSKPAAWLLVPYLGWVSFAAYLNAAIWIMNA